MSLIDHEGESNRELFGAPGMRGEGLMVEGPIGVKLVSGPERPMTGGIGSVRPSGDAPSR